MKKKLKQSLELRARNLRSHLSGCSNTNQHKQSCIYMIKCLKLPAICRPFRTEISTLKGQFKFCKENWVHFTNNASKQVLKIISSSFGSLSKATKFSCFKICFNVNLFSLSSSSTWWQSTRLMCLNLRIMEGQNDLLMYRKEALVKICMRNKLNLLCHLGRLQSPKVNKSFNKT